MLTYTEFSPSNGGVKLIGLGRKPDGAGCKSKKIPGFKDTEVYDHARFFTITGAHVPGTPRTVNDCQEPLNALCQRLWPLEPKRPARKRVATTAVDADDETLIRLASEAKNGSKFRQLWAGDTSGHGDDDSVADLALCNLLAFWTGRDADRMDRLFRWSGLYREKWEREDYRQRTIQKAIDSCAEVYSPRPQLSRQHDGAVLAAPVVEGPFQIRLMVRDITNTPRRQNIRFAVHIAGKDTEMELAATDTPGGVRAAAKDLAEIYASTQTQPLTPEQLQEFDWLVAKVLASTSIHKLGEQLKATRPAPTESATPTDPSMYDIALKYMHEEMGLAFVDRHGGLWSKRQGRVFDRNEFTNWLPPQLLAQIASAADYPEPTPLNPTKPIRHLQLTLRPVWTALASTLPTEPHAGQLGPSSKAADAFRQAIYHLWLIPETWMKTDPGQGELGRVERMSLASRVRELAHLAARQPPRWDRVLKGVNAFYRVEKGEDGPVVWLAMRADLCHGEIKGTKVEGVGTQENLSVLMSRYGLADEGTVPDRLREEGRRRRVCVLSRTLCDYLIECVNPPEEATPVPDPTPPAGTGGLDGEVIDMTTGEVLQGT